MFTLLGIITLIPAVDAMVSSFTTRDFLSGTFDVRTFIGLANYRYILRDNAIRYSLNITILWSLCNVFFSVTISLLLAHYMHMRSEKPRRPWALVARILRRSPPVTKSKKTPLMGFLLIPLGIPIYIAVPIWRAFLHGDAGVSLFSRLSGISLNLLTNPVAAFCAALVVSIWMNIPLTTMIIHAHLGQVETELLDSARLETKSRLLTMRYLQFPLIRTSVLIMIALNFVKACKEFTLIHLMTDGGAPLISGITDHYIIGSTTTLGIFLYDLFTSFNNYGITATFSVLMSALVLTTLVFWIISTRSNAFKRHTLSKIVLVALTFVSLAFGLVLPGGRLSLPLLVVAAFFCASLFNDRFFVVGALLFVVHMGIDIAFNGFLAGFSPLLPAVAFVFAQRPSTGKSVRPISSSQSIPHVQSITRAHFRSVKLQLAGEKIGEKVYLGSIYVAKTFLVVSSSLIVYYLIWLSVSGINAVHIDALFPRMLTLESFKILLGRERILHYFANTAIIATGAAILTPLVVIPGAWYLSTINKQRSNIIVSGVHVLGTIGGMHSLIPLFAIFIFLGLLNTRFGLVLVYAVHAVPFALFTIKNFFEGKPKELREPALLEGATALQYLRYILIPLSRPIVKTAMILAFLGAWNGFTAPLIFLTNEELYPVSLKLYSYVGSIGSASPKWNLFAAASVINLIFIRLLGYRPTTVLHD
jgi:multiple sugar transport system permease protein